MTFQQLSISAAKQFPKLQIGYKDQSLLMKIIGTIFFFNKAFMTEYTTTIGNTIYFPNQDYINSNDAMSSIILLHELVHIYDSSKRNDILYSFLYVMPQIFVLLAIPLFFIFGLKIALLALIFLAPLPSYFRMVDERRAYTISMYASNKLNILPDVDFYVSQFNGLAYYCMWPFSSIDTYFNNISTQILAGNKPVLEPELYDIIDKVLES